MLRFVGRINDFLQNGTILFRIQAFDVNDVNILVNELIHEAVQHKNQVFEKEIIRPIIKKNRDDTIEGAGAVKYTFKFQYGEGKMFCFQYQSMNVDVGTLAYYASPFARLEEKLKDITPYNEMLDANENKSDIVKRAFKTHNIVPDILKKAPEMLSEVAFGEEAKANLGNLLNRCFQ